VLTLASEFINNIVVTVDPDSGQQHCTILDDNNWAFDNFTLNNNIYWSLTDHEVDDFRFPPGGPGGGNTTFDMWVAEATETFGNVHDVDSQIVDPLFVDAPDDLNLDEGSKAWDLGWEEIDLSDVGPRAVSLVVE